MKALDQLAAIHSQQLYTYLRLSGCCVGLLLNFGAKRLTDGLRRLVHNFPDN